MATTKTTISTDSLMVEKRRFAPSAEVIKRAYIDDKKYAAMYKESITNSDNFWLEQAATLEWFKKPSVARQYVWDTANRKIEHTWFKDGTLNISVNCLDRHLKTKNRTRTAIIWQGEPLGDVRKITYEELHREVCKFANVLKASGIKKGDRVCIYMPMIIELPVAMLACARIGAIHSVVFGGFSAEARLLPARHPRPRPQSSLQLLPQPRLERQQRQLQYLHRLDELRRQPLFQPHLLRRQHREISDPGFERLARRAIGRGR